MKQVKAPWFVIFAFFAVLLMAAVGHAKKSDYCKEMQESCESKCPKDSKIVRFSSLLVSQALMNIDWPKTSNPCLIHQRRTFNAKIQAALNHQAAHVSQKTAMGHQRMQVAARQLRAIAPQAALHGLLPLYLVEIMQMYEKYVFG